MRKYVNVSSNSILSLRVTFHTESLSLSTENLGIFAGNSPDFVKSKFYKNDGLL